MTALFNTRDQICDQLKKDKNMRYFDMSVEYDLSQGHWGTYVRILYYRLLVCPQQFIDSKKALPKLQHLKAKRLYKEHRDRETNWQIRRPSGKINRKAVRQIRILHITRGVSLDETNSPEDGYEDKGADG